VIEAQASTGLKATELTHSMFGRRGKGRVEPEYGACVIAEFPVNENAKVPGRMGLGKAGFEIADPSAGAFCGDSEGPAWGLGVDNCHAENRSARIECMRHEFGEGASEFKTNAFGIWLLRKV
jgi:hypothetical protein